MNDNAVIRFCGEHGIKLPYGWRHCFQAVRYHNKNETKKHFMAKAEIAFEIMKRGGSIFTEFPLRKGAVCDLFWLDELMVLEFESQRSFQKTAVKNGQYKMFNLWVIDLEELSVEDVLKKIGLKEVH